MWLLIQLLFVTFLSSDTIGQVLKDYDGYKLYKADLKSSDKREILKKFEGAEDFAALISSDHNDSHFLVSPRLQKEFGKILLKNKINSTIINENVGESVLQEYEQRMKAVTRSFELTKYDFGHFPRYYEIIEYMKILVQNRRYSQIIEIGTSSKNKVIYAMKIEKSSKNPVFILDAGFHAREWAAHVAALYIIKKLVHYEEKYADMMTFIIIPCVNPDGYEYSHTTDRFWRKTRSDNKRSSCKGVDLNRNFDTHWKEISNENRECAETYPGPKPFSEPESIALRDTILMYQPYAYITLHSFGSLIMYPWGFTKDLPKNWQVLHQIALKAAQSANNGTNYTVGSSARVLYIAFGGSDDWAMEKAGVPIVYTVELPEFNGKLFVMPQEEIRPMVRETYKILKHMIFNIYDEYMQ
ncbi:PREDICTED: carboxypeptidase B-like [Ceratosolen solmsi marchali]|uniref:Carboxypeptidase B-like n=1 Tax=Ceratosolen solmsi marchali TaxID=326594 RepID=A0AAJ6YVU2_9HYME|nr:PREDICTED: carboxypeptidase B-like [Ceratosolen solmsi marchali]